MIRWAGLSFLFWALDLADGFLAISFHVLSTMDYWACWALDPWWITEVLDFEPLVDHWGVGHGLPWTEKMGLYTYIQTFNKLGFQEEITGGLLSPLTWGLG